MGDTLSYLRNIQAEDIQLQQEAEAKRKQKDEAWDKSVAWHAPWNAVKAQFGEDVEPAAPAFLDLAEALKQNGRQDWLLKVEGVLVERLKATPKDEYHKCRRWLVSIIVLAVEGGATADEMDAALQQRPAWVRSNLPWIRESVTDLAEWPEHNPAPKYKPVMVGKDLTATDLAKGGKRKGRKRREQKSATLLVLDALKAWHKYDKGNIENYDPASVEKLREMSGVGAGSVSRAFVDLFGAPEGEGHKYYSSACAKDGQLGKILLLKAGDVSIHKLQFDEKQYCGADDAEYE